MKAARFSPRYAGFSLALGCVIGYYILPPAALPWAAAVFCAAALALIFIKRAGRFAVPALACAVGIAGIWIQTAVFYAPAWEHDGEMVHITATAREDAVMLSRGQRVLVSWRRNNALLYIFNTDIEPVLAGDTINTYAYAAAARDDQYSLRLTAEETSVERPGALPFTYLPRVWARALSARLSAVMPYDTAPIARSILLGDTSGLSEKSYDALSESGLVHTASVSGMHVSALVGFVLLLTGRRRKLSLLALPPIVLFVLVTGCLASAVRAGVMQGSMLLAGALGRDENPLGAMELALGSILIFNPMSISDVGLQLSFTAVLGLCLYAGRLEQWFLKKLPAARLSWLAGLRKAFASSLSATLAAMLFSTPITAAVFGKVSIISPVSNLLCLWAVTWLFIGCIAALALSLLYLPAAVLIGRLLTPVSSYFLGMSRLLSGVPYASVYSEQTLIVLWLVLAYALIVVFLLPQRERMRPWVLAALLSGTLAAALVCVSLGGRFTRLEISVLDAGRGQSVLITSGGRAALIDCGGGGQTARAAAGALRARGLGSVEYVILTGTGSDYYSGISGLRERANVRNLLTPDIQGLTGEIPVEHVTELPLGNAALYILPLPAGSDKTDSKLCVFVRSGGFLMAASGDLAGIDERALLRLYEIPPSELVVSGVSGASVSEEWLSAAKPRAVIIPAGGDNLLGRIALSGARAYQTGKQGTVRITVN